MMGKSEGRQDYLDGCISLQFGTTTITVVAFPNAYAHERDTLLDLSRKLAARRSRQSQAVGSAFYVTLEGAEVAFTSRHAEGLELHYEDIKDFRRRVLKELDIELQVPADAEKHQQLKSHAGFLVQLIHKGHQWEHQVEQFQALDKELRLLGADPKAYQELQLQAQELRQLALKAEKEEPQKKLQSVQDEGAGVDYIHAAAHDGDLEKLQTELAKGVDKDAPRGSGEVALHWAAKGGNAKIAEFLIAEGAKKAVLNSFGELPAHWAADLGNVEVLEVLLDKADQERTDEYGETLLHRAARKGRDAVVNLLLRNNANKEAVNNFGRTPLLLAADCAHVHVLKALLKNGANQAATTSKEDDCQTALHLAAAKGSEKIAGALLEAGATKDCRDLRGQTALMSASCKGHVAVVELLLEAGVDKDLQDRIYGQTALMSASCKGHVAVVELLLEADVDKDLQDRIHGLTALMLAADNGHVAVVQLLLEAAADKDLQDGYGWTALTRAADSGNVAVAQLLLDGEADKELQDKDGLAAKRGPAHQALSPFQRILDVGSWSQACTTCIDGTAQPKKSGRRGTTWQREVVKTFYKALSGDFLRLVSPNSMRRLI